MTSRTIEIKKSTLLSETKKTAKEKSLKAKFDCTYFLIVHCTGPAQIAKFREYTAFMGYEIILTIPGPAELLCTVFGPIKNMASDQTSYFESMRYGVLFQTLFTGYCKNRQILLKLTNFGPFKGIWLQFK